MKKVISVILAASFLTSVLTSCGSKNNTSVKDTKATGTSATDYLNMDSEFPIVKNPITLKVVGLKEASSGSPDKIWFWKWAEKTMNIKFNVQLIDTGAQKEKINLMFAANEFPDFFYGVDFSTSDIIRYGQIEKQLMALNPFVEKYGSNMKKAFAEKPEVKAQTTCPDGNIYALPGYGADPYSVPRVWINNVWLNKLGLKIPQTLDELYTVLKAFRERDPNGNGKQDEIPMSGGEKELNPSSLIYSALGFPVVNSVGNTVEPVKKPVLKDGKVVIPAGDPLYAEYIKYMAKLFKEGLLDNDFFTNKTVQIRAKGAELRVGVHADSAPYLTTANNWKDYEALNPLTSQWNNKKVWSKPQDFIANRLAIPSSCKYPEAAIRFADFFFSDKGSVYSWLGPKKGDPDTLGITNGWYINEKGVRVYDLPDGVKSNYDFVIGSVAPGGSSRLGNNYFDTALEKLYNVKALRTENEVTWRESMDKYVMPHTTAIYPVVYFDQKQNDRVLELTTTINDYVTMMSAKLITGAEPISNIDSYFTQVKKLGIDELTKLYQDAYENYKKNLGK